MQTLTAAAAAAAKPGRAHNFSYELRAVLLLFLGFGMVGIDRFVINPLFPVMAKDLGLSYGDLGLISGVLSFTWGLSAIFSGGVADRIGPKKVLVPALLIFSVLVAATGFATGLLSLLLIRGIMGFAEGAYMPAAIVSTIDASKPSRIGLNTGITQMAIGLFGMGLAPILAVQMLKVVPNWHWVFGLVAVPGLVLAVLLHKVLRTPAAVPASLPNRAAGTAHAARPAGGWREVFSHRNVVFATLAMLCWLSCMIVLQAFMPNYLTDHLKLGLDDMAFVLSGAGAGSVVGMVGLAALSDKLGRKRVMLAALVIELIGLWFLFQAGAEPARLFALLFIVTMTNTGLIVITVGPLANESVPPHLAASASGLVMGLGEIVGGAIVPAATGALASVHGIQVILPIVIGAVVIGLAITLLGIREPVKRH